jgi:hypothetical protein
MGGVGGEMPMTCEPPELGGLGGAGGDGDLELVGEFTTDYGGTFNVTETLVDMGFAKFHVVSFDNDAGTIVAQNDANNSYYPCLFSRFDWQKEGGSFYYCQSGYAAESEDAALMTMPADAADLEGGCGGFPWSALTEN